MEKIMETKLHDYSTAQEIAKLLNCTLPNVRDLKKRHEWNGVRVNTTLFVRSDIDQYLERMQSAELYRKIIGRNQKRKIKMTVKTKTIWNTSYGGIATVDKEGKAVYRLTDQSIRHPNWRLMTANGEYYLIEAAYAVSQAFGAAVSAAISGRTLSLAEAGDRNRAFHEWNGTK